MFSLCRTPETCDLVGKRAPFSPEPLHQGAAVEESAQKLHGNASPSGCGPGVVCAAWSNRVLKETSPPCPAWTSSLVPCRGSSFWKEWKAPALGLLDWQEHSKMSPLSVDLFLKSCLP